MLGLELLYVLVVNAVLNAPVIPGLISNENIGMSWAYAISLFPGQVTVHGFFMRLQDPNIQFSLTIGETQAHFTLHDLLHHTFHIVRVDGDHAVYLMRMRRTPEEVAATDLSTLPLIEGFPAIPLRWAVEPPPSGPPDLSKTWTAHIEGVHVNVDEAWFEDLRWRGVSAATGSFTLTPDHLVIVDGHWHVQSGYFTLGHDPLAEDIRGDASVRISPFDPRQAPGNMPLRYLDGLLTMEGRLSDARFLNPVLAQTTAPHFASDEGHFEVYFHFDRGRVATGTQLRMHAKEWRIGRGRYMLQASYADLTSSVDDIDGVPTSQTNLDLGPYDVYRLPEPDDPGGELLTGDGMVLRLSATELDTLGPFFFDLAYEFKLHEARMQDLRRLNGYLPGTRMVEVLGGQGTISGDYVSPADDSGHGVVDIEAKDAAVRVQRVRIGGDLRMHWDLNGVASDSQRLVIVGNRPLGATGHVEGSFRVMHPGDLLAALPPIGSGEVTSDFTLDPLTPPEVTRRGLWHFLSAATTVKGRFDGLSFLPGFFAGPAPVNIAGGAGTFALDTRFAQGRLEPGSQATLTADGVQISWNDYRAQANAVLSASLQSPGASAEAQLHLRQGELQVDGETLLTAGDLLVAASTKHLDLSDMLQSVPSMTLRTAQLKIPSLRALDRYLPEKAFRFEEGAATLRAELVSPASGLGRAHLNLDVAQAVARNDDLVVAGDLDLTVELEGIGETPWRPGLWERSRPLSHENLVGQLEVRPAPESQESGRMSLRLRAQSETSSRSGTEPSWHDVVESLSAQATIDGDIRGVGYLNHYLSSHELRAEGGDGSLHLSLAAAHGELSPGSWAHLNLTGVDLRAGGLALAATTDVTAVVGPNGPNRLGLRLALGDYELHYLARSAHAPGGVADPVLLRGNGLRVEARSDTIDPLHVPEASSVSAQMGEVRVPDLRALNLFLPATHAVTITGGQAQLTGRLDKRAHAKSTAALELRGTQTQFELAGHRLQGDFQLKAAAATVVPGTGWSLPRSIDLSGSGFSLSNVDFDKGSGVTDGWWMTLDLPQASLGFEDRPVAVGKLELKTRDLETVLQLFQDQLGIPGILTPYLAFDDLHGFANLLAQPEMIEITEADLRSTRLRLRGRVLADAAGTRGELLLNDPPLAFGIALHKHGTGLQIWGAEGWYRNHLSVPLAEEQ
jgi:hypothetical protein